MSDCKKLQKNEAAAAAKRPKVEQEESPPKHQRTILQFDEPTRNFDENYLQNYLPALNSFLGATKTLCSNTEAQINILSEALELNKNIFDARLDELQSMSNEALAHISELSADNLQLSANDQELISGGKYSNRTLNEMRDNLYDHKRKIRTISEMKTNLEKLLEKSEVIFEREIDVEHYLKFEL